MNLEECLPLELRSPSTKITRVAAGLSGAGVYRVDAGGGAFILKVAADNESSEAWVEKVSVLRTASTAGLAPAVVHVEESRRAVLSRFVVDRSFRALYANPATQEVAVARLGQTLRRVHGLPLPGELRGQPPLELLDRVTAGLAGYAVPAFARSVAERLRAESPPESGRPVVLSHNDVNPTNLILDGENLLLLDWDMAGPNDPLYDLAAIAVFVRMDEPTCLRLLSAHEGVSVRSLPAQFLYLRRVVAVLCGTIFLMLARHGGHAGDAGIDLGRVLTLGELHGLMGAGQLHVGSADGQWAFGLALLRTAIELEAAERST